MNEATKKAIEELVSVLDELEGDELIEAINAARLAIHERSPFRDEPVDCVRWVAQESIRANDYNPNAVAPPEMQLLEHSIREDGYTQPIVVFEYEVDRYEVIDGFHRNRVGRESPDIRGRVRAHLPVTVINGSRVESKDRIASTIRHNRARGVHGIEPMAAIVARLYFNGWSNRRICRELGMERDEVLRLKQFTGLGTLFEHRSYSKSWDLEEIEDDGASTDE